LLLGYLDKHNGSLKRSIIEMVMKIGSGLILDYLAARSGI